MSYFTNARVFPDNHYFELTYKLHKGQVLHSICTINKVLFFLRSYYLKTNM